MGPGEAFPVISWLSIELLIKETLAQSPKAALHALQILKYSQAALFSSVDS